MTSRSGRSRSGAPCPAPSRRRDEDNPMHHPFGGIGSRFSNESRQEDFAPFQLGSMMDVGSRFGGDVGGVGICAPSAVGGDGPGNHSDSGSYGGSGAFHQGGGLMGRNRFAGSQQFVSAGRNRSAFSGFKPTNPFDLKTPSNPRNVKALTAGLKGCVWDVTRVY